jgi:hypothetical protein
MSTLPVKPSSWPPRTDSLAGDAPTPAEAVTDLINLPTGKELDELEAAKLQVARPVRLVVVAGPVGSGKTTLIASLYELFQWSRVSDYLFAGSNTLAGFEQRCYLSRIDSERIAPNTERTLHSDVRYLHLQIWKENFKRGPLDLLFTDITGESFESARDSTAECQHLEFLRLADHFLLLLDGEKLVHKEKRWKVAHEGMGLLRSCLDSKMLSGTSLVNVVFAKFDYLHAAWNEENDRFLGKLMDEFQKEFDSRVGRLTFSRVAARPTESSKLSFGHGLAELLEDWAVFSPRERSMKILLHEAPGTSQESELFGVRHFGSSWASE